MWFDRGVAVENGDKAAGEAEWRGGRRVGGICMWLEVMCRVSTSCRYGERPPIATVGGASVSDTQTRIGIASPRPFEHDALLSPVRM